MTEKPKEPTEEQRAEVDKALEKMFRAYPTTDEDGEPVLAIALDTVGMFLMGGTLNRGMALTTSIMATLADPDDQKKAEARATLALARAQVAAFTKAMNAFVKANAKAIKEISGAGDAFADVIVEEEKGDE